MKWAEIHENARDREMALTPEEMRAWRAWANREGMKNLDDMPHERHAMQRLFSMLDKARAEGVREGLLESAPLDAIIEKARAEAVADFVQRVNTRAEADILAGNPVTGAHHRAIEVEAAAIRARSQEEK